MEGSAEADKLESARPLRDGTARPLGAGEREWIDTTPDLKIEFLEYSWELDDAK